MVSANAFKKAAIYGAAVSVIGATFFHHRIQVKIASQDYYKKSVQVMRNHQLAAETIGKPLRFPYMNLARKDIKIDHKTAQIVIPVRGSNTKGNLYSFASRADDTGWVLERVELDVDQGRLRIKIVPED
ncbi:cytochrome c oxidase assembly factor 1 homolog isoform X1 [Oculina patagonica]